MERYGRFTTTSNCNLTSTQAEVALRLAAGMSNKEIARDLEIQPISVTKRIERMRSKLKARNRTELVSNLFVSKAISHLLILLTLSTLIQPPGDETAANDDPRQPRHSRYRHRQNARARNRTRSRTRAKHSISGDLIWDSEFGYFPQLEKSA